MRRTSMNLDIDLVAQAKEELGTKSTTETVHAALQEIVSRARITRLLAVRFDHLPDDWDDRLERQWGPQP